MDYRIREMKQSEIPLLSDFLYEAIFVPEGEPAPNRSVLKDPAISVYIDEFGSLAGDYCLCAEADGEIAGAVWVRNIHGYGSVDNETPEFAISLLKKYRGQGIGTQLMRRMLDYLAGSGYKRASLSVQKANRALNLYLKVGFRIAEEREEEYIMVYAFD